MSNVYHFDDKILHIDSLQLKRTNDILNSREEAVEALLNYCGDDTVDGMPLLARYWADSGQTEIKHVRGYIHYLPDGQGISVDDICDFDPDDIIHIIQEYMSGVTESVNLGHFPNYKQAQNAITSYTSNEVPQGTKLVATYDLKDTSQSNAYAVLIGEVSWDENSEDTDGRVIGKTINPGNVIYWETTTNRDPETGEVLPYLHPTEATHKMRPFWNRNGMYEASKQELYSLDSLFGQNVEKHADPMVYVMPMFDERRHGAGWVGTKPIVANERYNFYSALSIYSGYKKDHVPGENVGNNPTLFYNHSILDPRKYEKKIHYGIHLGGRAQGRNDNYVIKKPYPVYARFYQNYYYEGQGVRFEFLSIPPGCKYSMILDNHWFPYDYNRAINDDRYNGFGYALHVAGGEFRSMFSHLLDNGEIFMSFTTADTGNTITFENRSDVYSHAGYITLEYRPNPDENDERAGHILIKPKGTIDYIERRGPWSWNPLRCGKGIPEGMDNQYRVDYRGTFDVEVNVYGTFDTTSPGFRIEEGKIKCYRSSSFKAVLDAFGKPGSVKYIKDGTTFYRHERNFLNGGVSQRTVMTQSTFLDQIFNRENNDGRNWIKKEVGSFEFVKRIARGKTDKTSSEDYETLFWCTYLGYDESNPGEMECHFKIDKYASDDEIWIDKIGVAFFDVNGEYQEGYFSNYRFINSQEYNEAFPMEAGTYEIVASNFHIKDKLTNEGMHGDNMSSSFGNSMRIIYMAFNMGEGQVKPVRFRASHYSGDVPHNRKETTTRRVRGKWAPITQPNNPANPVARQFNNSYFNRCRYIRKYKGVPSEFPELFYTR